MPWKQGGWGRLVLKAEAPQPGTSLQGWVYLSPGKEWAPCSIIIPIIPLVKVKGTTPPFRTPGRSPRHLLKQPPLPLQVLAALMTGGRRSTGCTSAVGFRDHTVGTENRLLGQAQVEARTRGFQRPHGRAEVRGASLQHPSTNTDFLQMLLPGRQGHLLPPPGRWALCQPW